MGLRAVEDESAGKERKPRSPQRPGDEHRARREEKRSAENEEGRHDGGDGDSIVGREVTPPRLGNRLGLGLDERALEHPQPGEPHAEEAPAPLRKQRVNELRVVTFERTRDLSRRVPGVGERGDQIAVRGLGAEGRVDPERELGARVQAVLQPGQLVQQLALGGGGRRLRDALEAYKDSPKTFPESRHGSRVCLAFPCPHSPLHALADDTRLHSGPMVAQDRPAIVVADDDDGMRMLCRVNLELGGYRVLEAGSGEELDRVLAESDAVALLLLDIHLGDRDGMDIARALRKERPEIPIAFLTGSGFVSREEADAVGDATIRKPFTLEELTETVSRLART